MDFLLFLLFLGLVCLLFYTLFLAKKSNERSRILEARFNRLEERILKAQSPKPEPENSFSTPETAIPSPTMASTPWRAPSPPTQTPAPLATPSQPAVPPPIPPTAPQPDIPEKDEVVYASPLDAINWEQFMGVKLFAWLGGLALFLAVSFFIKYSFERDLIPPALRVTLGFLTGLGLVVGGALLNRKDYKITAQSLCGTGVVSLYAVTFAGHAVYEFPLFSVIPTFLLMIAVTVTAFLLAVRLNAMVVAVLGMLGGFLTPMLLSTGQDNPVGLFGYIALLDLGLLAVAYRKRWDFLSLGAAVGTALMQLGWLSAFFTMSNLRAPLVVFLMFNGLFLLATEWARRRDRLNPWLEGSATGLPFVTLGFAVHLVFQPELNIVLLSFLGLILGADLCLIALSLVSQRLRGIDLMAGLSVFLMISLWTTLRMTSDLLPWALGITLVFAVLHTVFPLLKRRWLSTSTNAWMAHLFPPAGVLLLLLPMLKLEETSFFIWPVVMLVDLLAIFLAVLSASFAALLFVTLLTAVLAGVWMFRLPAEAGNLWELLMVIGGFGIFFMLATMFLTRKFNSGANEHDQENEGSTRANWPMPSWLQLPANFHNQVPAVSAVLPFMLLLILVSRFSLSSPNAIFALTLTLVIMLLVMTRWAKLSWLPLIGLIFTTLVEWNWHIRNHSLPLAALTLGWFLVFLTAYTVFPFTRTPKLKQPNLIWAAAALSGPFHFFLVYQLTLRAWPNDFMGLVPAAFAVIYGAALYVLARLWRSESSDMDHAPVSLAWFGGVTLFFVTMIIPIQFERQWITVSWALEGAALLWLYHRIPHRGLQVTGLALLQIAFVRLTLNPAVLSYHTRGEIPVFNWYLYAYGITAIALYAGAWLMRPPRHLVRGKDARPLLITLGTVLIFLLMNIEIADFFSAPGTASLTFQFSGNFARDMTYTIASALFALGLLVMGIWRRLAPVRYTAIGLLGVVLFKLFFHDLSRLAQIYRIGALFGVAVIAILASLLYQKFLSERREGKK